MLHWVTIHYHDPCKTAELNETSYIIGQTQTRVGPGNHGSTGTYGHHQANTIERPVLGGDAGCRYRCRNSLLLLRCISSVLFYLIEILLTCTSREILCECDVFTTTVRRFVYPHLTCKGQVVYLTTGNDGAVHAGLYSLITMLVLVYIYKFVAV